MAQRSEQVPYYGALAQLGEHLLCKQGVIGSIPIGSTTFAASVALGGGKAHQGRGCLRAISADHQDILQG